jgi:hypothetical protein
MTTTTYQLTEETFAKFIQPRILPHYAKTAAEYLAKHPEAAQITVTTNDNGDVIAVAYTGSVA